VLRLSSPARTLVTLALLGTLVSLHLWVGQAALRARADEALFAEEESVYLPPVPVLRALGLGRNTFVADVVFLRAISYFAVHFVGDREFRWLDSLVDAVLELDPEFRKAYAWAATVVMYGGRIDNTSVRASNRLLERALEHFPDDWEFHLQLGTNYYFELRTHNDEQGREWKRIGAAHIESASNLPGAPDWLPLTVATMHKRTGQQELAIRHLEEVYLRTSDENLREQLAAHLTILKSRHAIETLEVERKRFSEAWQASYPYVPGDLFLLLGERPSRRLERVWEPTEE